MPRLTLLMPTYNAGLYIKEAIDSLLKQTFGDFELWIIDDGSTDTSRSIVDSYQDPRIRKFYYDENRGRVKVVNSLITEVKSEYVSVTDADDVSHPQRLFKQIAIMDKDKSVAMCGTSFWAIYEDGVLLRELLLSDDYEKIRNDNLIRSQFLGATTIFRTPIVANYPEFYRLYFIDNKADTDLAARVVDQHKSVNLTEPLYYYRIVGNSLSRKKFSIRFASIDRIIAFLSKQRRTVGLDSLQTKNEKDLNNFIAQLANDYEIDPSRIYREAAFYHLYWKTIDKAIPSIWLALKTKPFHKKNLLSLVYVFGKSLFYFLQKIGREKYTSLMKAE